MKPVAVTKAVATIASTDGDTTAPNGSFEAILSAPTVDRDGDVFATAEWKTPLPDRITIDMDHGMSVASTVGSAVPSIDRAGNLRIKGTYASTPQAQQVRTLVNEGHIRTMSVAAMTDRDLKSAGEPCRELLNGAFVAIPSNREARVLSSKSADVPANALDPDTVAQLVDLANALPTLDDDEAANVVYCIAALCGELTPGDDDDAVPDDSGATEGANKALSHRARAMLLALGV